MSPSRLRGLQHLDERVVGEAGFSDVNSFFDQVSIHEVTYGLLEDWSLWLANDDLLLSFRHTAPAGEDRVAPS